MKALRKAMEINDLQAKAMLESVKKLGTFPDVRQSKRAPSLFVALLDTPASIRIRRCTT